MVGGETSRPAVLGFSLSISGCGLLVREQASDGLDGVAHVLPAPEVTGESSPVLEVCDPVLDVDTP